MLTPQQIQEIIDTLFPMLDNLNAWITKDLLRRLMARVGRGEALMLTASDEWQLQVYQAAGGHLEAVQQQIKKFTRASDAEIARIFEDAGIKALTADNLFYVAAGQRELPMSNTMVRILTDLYQRTNGTIHNFTRTTAETSQQKLIRLLDETHLKVMTGAQSYTAAVSDAVNEIAGSQIQVKYPTGHIDTIETAVLRAVRTGVAQAAGNMSLQGMIERDWDLIRVSAHIGARYGDGGENPSNHFWWQGKLYSRTGRTPGYPLFETATGYGTGEGLCGWNCRHSFGPGDPDHNPFEDFDSEENTKAFDLSQQQRKMEARIRRTKLKLIGLRQAIESAEDNELKATLEAKYTKGAKLLEKQNLAYTAFCDEHNLRRLSDRISVAQWTREDAKKSIAAAKK